MKELNGQELAGFIKERQAKQVRGLRQAAKVFPKLAIIATIDDPVITTYVKLKQKYGQDIQVEVDIHDVPQAEALGLIESLNHDQTVHGIIVQLPLADPNEKDMILNRVSPAKDVDGLGSGAILDPAAPTAILWLLAGYNIELTGKQVVIVGNGQLVGAPLARMLRDSGIAVDVVDETTDNLAEHTKQADILITAAGAPGLITTDMIPEGCVVVDAGVSTDSGKTVGDLAEDVYSRDDLAITPRKGGVGPLTVCALFDNVIRAARATAENQRSS